MAVEEGTLRAFLPRTRMDRGLPANVMDPDVLAASSLRQVVEMADQTRWIAKSEEIIGYPVTPSSERGAP